MKLELSKKGLAFATAGLLALASLGFAGVASAASTVLDPTDSDDAALIFDNVAAGTNATLDINKTINAPAGTDVAGMTYTFDFQAVAPVQNNGVTETGAQVVPNATAAMVAADSNQTLGQPIDLQTIVLTAGAQSADTQSLNGNIVLPDPNFYGNAGVYTYEVLEAVSNYQPGDSAANWDNDGAKYRLRLYVKNDTQSVPVSYVNTNDPTDIITAAAYNNLNAAAQEAYEVNESRTENILTYDMVTIEKILEGIQGDTTSCEIKVGALDFVNTYKALSQLEVKKTVTGEYGNRAKEFPFTLEITLPDYYAGQTITVGIDGTDTTLNVATTGGKKVITIPAFTLSADESTVITGLPVGSIYQLVETDPTDGVNNYVPSAEYIYSGAQNADTGFGTATNTVAAGTAGAANYTVYAATAATQNAKTAIGAGSGNKVTVDNELDNPPSPTGILVETLPFALGFVVAATLIAVVIVSRRREGEDA